MKRGYCTLLWCAGLALGLTVQSASAQIVLSQPSFEAGQKYAAFFRVEHGCADSPTVSLRVAIPQGVTVLETPAKPEWMVKPEGDKDDVRAVTWRGKLAAKQADQFGLLLKLPAKPGLLYFPTVQQCEKGEARWVDIPAAGQAWRDVPHPAPVLQLIAATTPPPTMFMAGEIMIDLPWGPATPRGASTAAAYMTVMNHGMEPDTLLGATSPVGQIEIHQMSNANGVMSMRQVTGGLPLAPGAIIFFDPKSDYHLMVSGLKAPLMPGTRMPATLNFQKAGPVQVEFSIGPIGSRVPPVAGAARR
jgi:hypothetical protein